MKLPDCERAVSQVDNELPGVLRFIVADPIHEVVQLAAPKLGKNGSYSAGPGWANGGPFQTWGIYLLSEWHGCWHHTFFCQFAKI